MLDDQQIDHYRTFGFVVLRDLLGAQRTTELHAEVAAALRDAYGAAYEERTLDGISGHYLPMASRLTPVSAALICDDDVLIGAAEQLLGGPALPAVPEGVLYFADSAWHDEDGIGVHGVKFATYFDELEADNGALRLVPCSHLEGVPAALRAYQRARHVEVPSAVAGTRPGDLIAFDVHTFHASFGGRDRLGWATEYLAEPQGEPARSRTHAWMTDAFEQGFHGFDRERYPTWRDWLAEAAAHPRRTVVLERLRRAGILELRGAELGW